MLRDSSNLSCPLWLLLILPHLSLVRRLAWCRVEPLLLFVMQRLCQHRPRQQFLLRRHSDLPAASLRNSAKNGSPTGRQPLPLLRLLHLQSLSELRSAVIWNKGVSTYTPDYFVELLPTSPWIHQPFEEYDDLRPAGLAKKFAI